MVDFIDNPDNDFRKTLSNKYLLVDLSEREFFAKHTKRATSSDSQGMFDDEAIKEIINSHNDKLINILENRQYVNINLGHMYNGDISYIANTSKQDVLLRIMDMYQNGELNNIPNIEQKISDIKNVSDFNLAKFDELYSVEIDGKNYHIDSELLKNIILSDFKTLDFNKDLNINGLNKNEFCFILRSFIKHNNIKYNYILPDDSKRFIQDILNDKYANTYHFNNLTQTHDQFLFDVVLNDDLKNYVYKDMSKNYSDLEKSIFVYIKLCKLLTYDPEFYANNQAGGVARLHEDITRLGTISTQETRVVCYEFTQLYARFLYDMGFNYYIDRVLDDYGDGHVDVKFRAGEYIINADSVTSIIGGDLYNAKINGELEGLKCQNKNINTLKSFQTAYDKVYNDIIKTEDIKESDEGLFYDFLDMFDALCEKEHVSIDKKREIFEKRCKEIQLPTIDKLTYVLTLAKSIFEEEIAKDQFDATIISRKEIDGFNIKTMPTMVYSFNPKSFKTAPEETEYMMMDKNGNMQKVYKETLVQSFSVGAMKHISAGVKNRHKIPGIDVEVTNVK